MTSSSVASTRQRRTAAVIADAIGYVDDFHAVTANDKGDSASRQRKRRRLQTVDDVLLQRAIQQSLNSNHASTGTAYQRTPQDTRSIGAFIVPPLAPSTEPTTANANATAVTSVLHRIQTAVTTALSDAVQTLNTQLIMTINHSTTNRLPVTVISSGPNIDDHSALIEQIRYSLTTASTYNYTALLPVSDDLTTVFNGLIDECLHHYGTKQQRLENLTTKKRIAMMKRRRKEGLNALFKWWNIQIKRIEKKINRQNCNEQKYRNDMTVDSDDDDNDDDESTTENADDNDNCNHNQDESKEGGNEQDQSSPMNEENDNDDEEIIPSLLHTKPLTTTKTNKHNAKLILFLPAITAYSPALLNALFTHLLHEPLLSQIPMHIICLTCTDASILVRRISDSVLTKLLIRSFRLGSIRSMTQSLLERTVLKTPSSSSSKSASSSSSSMMSSLMSDLPFILTSECRAFITNEYMNQHNSLSALKRALQFMTIIHFDKQPYAYLAAAATSHDDEHLRTAVQTLTNTDCQLLRLLPSMQQHHRVTSFLTSMEDDNDNNTNNNNIVFKQQIIRWLNDLFSYEFTSDSTYELLIFTLQFLHNECSKINSSEIITNIMRQCEQVKTNSNKNIPLKISQCEWVIATMSILVHPTRLPQSNLQKLVTEWIKLCDKHELLKGELPFLNDIINQLNGKKVSASSSAASAVQTSITKKQQSRTRAPVNCILPAQVVEQQAALSKVRQALCDWFNNIVDTRCRHLRSLPLNELAVFDDVDALKHSLHSHHRRAVQTALTQPQVYLQEHPDATETAPSATSATSSPFGSASDDLLVLYRLYSEYGSWINVYDWMQAFVTVVNKNTAEHRHDTTSSSSSSAPSTDLRAVSKDLLAQLQVRFFDGVRTLQYLGYIAETEISSDVKANDHVQRIVFESGLKP